MTSLSLPNRSRLEIIRCVFAAGGPAACCSRWLGLSATLIPAFHGKPHALFQIAARRNRQPLCFRCPPIRIALQRCFSSHRATVTSSKLEPFQLSTFSVWFFSNSNVERFQSASSFLIPKIFCSGVRCHGCRGAQKLRRFWGPSCCCTAVYACLCRNSGAVIGSGAGRCSRRVRCRS
jgi:hypothetical protein